MTPIDAARILGSEATATPEQLETRFLELRTKLEDKIAKAPTPGLKEKYRASLAEITTAFETLTLAADASSLPVLQREPDPVATRAPSSNSPAASTPSTKSAPSTRSTPSTKSSKEFAIVTLLAVLLLGGGGWWVMKTRAEKAEQARRAEETRLAQEAAARAEAERIEKLATQLRSRLAELNVAYEAQVRIEALAERELSELKSQERDVLRAADGAVTPEARRLSARMQAQQRFVGWLHDTLPSHAATFARARAEELVSAKAFDEAATAIAAFSGSVEQLQQEVAAARVGAEVTGSLTVDASHVGARWKLTDSFGFTYTGTTPASLHDVAFGPVQIVFNHGTWPEQTLTAEMKRAKENQVRAHFEPGTLLIESTPADAQIEVAGATRNSDGSWTLEPGRHIIKADHPDFAPQFVTVEIQPGKELNQAVALNHDYAAPALHLARERLAQLKSDEEFYNHARSVAQELARAGDSEGAAALLAQRLARSPDSLEKRVFNMADFEVAAQLGRKDLVQGTVALWDRLLDAGRPDFSGNILGQKGSLMARAAALAAVGERSAAEPYVEEMVNMGARNVHRDDLRRFALDNVAVTLATAGFGREARTFGQQARSLGGNEDEFWLLNAALAMIDATEAIRRDQPADALPALRRVADMEMRGERMNYPHRQPDLRFNTNFLVAAQIARETRADNCARDLLAYLRQLEKDGLFRDPNSPNRVWREQVLQLLESGQYNAERKKVIAARARRFREAEDLDDPSQAIEALLNLRRDLLLYQADS